MPSILLNTPPIVWAQTEQRWPHKLRGAFIMDLQSNGRPTSCSHDVLNFKRDPKTSDGSVHSKQVPAYVSHVHVMPALNIGHISQPSSFSTRRQVLPWHLTHGWLQNCPIASPMPVPEATIQSRRRRRRKIVGDPA
jgi:hypothetical protein